LLLHSAAVPAANIANRLCCCFIDSPSQLAFAPLLTPLAQIDDMKFGVITDASVIMKPTGDSDNFGDEGTIWLSDAACSPLHPQLRSQTYSFLIDPRIVYNKNDGLYYLLYTEAQHYDNGTVLARLCYATSATPSNASSWIRHVMSTPFFIPSYNYQLSHLLNLA
jgi:hypothetical protein